MLFWYINSILRFRDDQIFEHYFCWTVFSLAEIEKLISIVCDIFSYSGMSISFKYWACKLHNIFVTIAETEVL